jgi:hypothetical protein
LRFDGFAGVCKKWGIRLHGNQAAQLINYGFLERNNV